MSNGPTDAVPTEPRWADIKAHRPLDPTDPREVGGYRLRARLGEGGMGLVYLSFTPGGRPIAIKIIRPEFAADLAFRRRFEQEVATAQRVQGLYTAPIIDANTQAEQPWLATAYVPGPSLQDTVGAYGPLPEESVLVLVAGVAEALQSIHGAGVIHRDLKPSNIILAADGPRVIDFGIARAADTTSVTQTGHQVGTPAFMAPEQVRGKTTTPALDIFALGVLACYAATGELPFGGGRDPAVPHRILEQEPDLAACPRRLVDLVTRCLAKDPQQRPSPAQVIELCRTLSADTRLQMGEDWLPPQMAAAVNRIAAAPIPPVPPQPRTRRRRITALLVGGAVILAAIIGGIFTLIAASDTNKKPSGTAQAPHTPPVRVPTSAVDPTQEVRPSSEPAGVELAVRWSGKISVQGFGIDDVVDLDITPPEAVSNSGHQGDIGVELSKRDHANAARPAFGTSALMRWVDGGTPEYGQCREKARAQGVGQVRDIGVDSVLCLRTNEHRIARLTVAAVDGKQDTVTFDVVVWESTR